MDHAKRLLVTQEANSVGKIMLVKYVMAGKIEYYGDQVKSDTMDVNLDNNEHKPNWYLDIKVRELMMNI